MIIIIFLSFPVVDCVWPTLSLKLEPEESSFSLKFYKSAMEVLAREKVNFLYFIENLSHSRKEYFISLALCLFSPQWKCSLPSMKTV